MEGRSNSHVLQNLTLRLRIFLNFFLLALISFFFSRLVSLPSSSSPATVEPRASPTGPARAAALCKIRHCLQDRCGVRREPAAFWWPPTLRAHPRARIGRLAPRHRRAPSGRPVPSSSRACLEGSPYHLARLRVRPRHRAPSTASALCRSCTDDWWPPTAIGWYGSACQQDVLAPLDPI
ncbi:hypothetical protein BS78_04G251400 [Paspalum vaginatum]|nr:hypothetical protein BS78_04G251400 [Paspalum vaginatum]